MQLRRGRSRFIDFFAQRGVRSLFLLQLAFERLLNGGKVAIPSCVGVALGHVSGLRLLRLLAQGSHGPLLGFERRSPLLELALKRGARSLLLLQRLRQPRKIALARGHGRAFLLHRRQRLAALASLTRQRGLRLFQLAAQRGCGSTLRLDRRPALGANRRKTPLSFPLRIEVRLSRRRVRFLGGKPGEIEDDLFERAMLIRIRQGRFERREPRIEQAAQRVEPRWRGRRRGASTHSGYASCYTLSIIKSYGANPRH